MADALTLPFSGVPLPDEILFAVAFALITVILGWTALLFAFGLDVRGERPLPDAASLPEAFTWVFLVPALNEEVTILDSVARLTALELGHAHIVAIDDGSDDDTPRLLGTIDDPRLHIVRRSAPDARRGKAAALNQAYRELGTILAEGIPRDQVIVGIVDADGRLSADSPPAIATHFADPRIGGVQSLVRIYNRWGLLTWLQDVEFGVYGCLYQVGRNVWGTAGMGGNGQFNRLSALDAVADETGPWRDRLTEDQDLGLRLIAAGWRGRQELRAVVEQQGLSNLRRLFRQRTRWSQGNLQAMGLIGPVWRGDAALGARTEQIAYLLMPVWQGIVGLALIISIILAVTGKAAFYGETALWQIVFFYVLAFGGVILGCLARAAGRGGAAALAGLLIAHAYALYTWMLWPVLIRATARQLTDRRDWAKTTREPILPPGAQEPPERSETSASVPKRPV